MKFFDLDGFGRVSGTHLSGDGHGFSQMLYQGAAGIGIRHHDGIFIKGDDGGSQNCTAGIPGSGNDNSRDGCDWLFHAGKIKQITGQAGAGLFPCLPVPVFPCRFFCCRAGTAADVSDGLSGKVWMNLLQGRFLYGRIGFQIFQAVEAVDIGQSRSSDDIGISPFAQGHQPVFLESVPSVKAEIVNRSSSDLVLVSLEIIL